jgi:hypothetical protein
MDTKPILIPKKYKIASLLYPHGGWNINYENSIKKTAEREPWNVEDMISSHKQIKNTNYNVLEKIFH